MESLAFGNFIQNERQVMTYSMRSIAALLLGFSLLLAGCTQPAQGMSQKDFDGMMASWMERNKGALGGSVGFSQAEFDKMIADWLKRREEEDRKAHEHGHSHEDGHGHNH